MFYKSLIAVALAIPLSTAASAHEYKIGDLIIDHPVVRATAPGAKVAGGYMVIVNTGKSDDRLTGGIAKFSTKTEIHEIKMQGDVMKMQAVPGGMVIPAGETVTLKPGSFHVMFMGLKEALKVGEKRTVNLTFEKAGSIDVIFQVKTIAETMKKMKMSN